MCCDISGEHSGTHGYGVETDGAAALADDVGEVGIGGLHLVGHILHLSANLVAVGLAGCDGHVDVLDVAHGIGDAEEILHLIVLALELLLLNGHVFLDAGIGEGGEEHILLGVRVVEAVLHADGVGDEGLGEECLILVGQRLLTDVLLDELPVVVELVVVGQCLGGLTRLILHGLVLGEELVELLDVESALLVAEGRLCEHGVLPVLNDVLHLCIADGESKLISLMLENLVLHVGAPNLVTHLLHLLFGEVLGSRAELDDIDIFVDEVVVLLDVDGFTEYFADALVALGTCGGKRTNTFLGDEGKECETHEENQQCTLASDLL